MTDTSIAHAESKATTNTTHSKANATSAYYNYKGYAGQDVSFVLDKHFKNAVKAENVTFNGIKLKATTSSKNVKNMINILETFRKMVKQHHYLI